MSPITDRPASHPGPATVRFGRRSTRGLILGLSTPRCVSAGVAVGMVVVGLVAAGGIGLVLSGMVWIPLLAGTFVTWQSKPIVEWVPVAGHWGLRRPAGQCEYRARVCTPRPAGTFALPGDAASLRFYDDPATGACMIHDPHRQTLSACLRVSHPAYVLLAPDDQHNRVSAWGRAYAALAHSGTCAAVQVLEQTVPDPGTGVTGWYHAHGTHGGGWADRQYQALLAQSSQAASTHRSTITIALDMRKAARAVRDAGRGVKGAAAVLAGDLTAVGYSIREAGLRVEGWLDGPAVAMMVRHAYDPGLEAHPGAPGISMGNAGPIAVSEHWSWLRHDSGYSTVLWISNWPRIDVSPHFLHALIFAPGVRKTLSIVARPLGTAEALKQIRREKTEAVTDSAHKAKVGQLADLSDAAEYADVLTRERALISGHADVEFSGFITVTAPSRDELTTAVALVERSATQAGCETRLVFGRQAQAFIVAALPFARSAL